MNKGQLESLRRKPPESVTIEGVGEVFIRRPTGGEYVRLLDKMIEWRDKAGGKPGAMPPPDVVLETVAIGLANADGSRMYSDSQLNDVGKLDPDVLLPIYGEVSRVIFGGEDDPKKD